jgi:transglutaminase-like putative cysteine protease
MLLRILHHTRYTYQAPVVVAQHLAHLRPLDLPSQTLLQHQLDIRPAPALQQTSRDALGNWRTFFSLQSPHDTLDVSASSLVQTRRGQELTDSPPWEAVRERLQYRAHAPYEAAAEFVFPSPYIARHEAFSNYARTAFAPGRPWLDACCDLMAQIHADFEYQPASTGVNTPALQALALRQGVCQDFAHIMIACLRSLGLPARYVSGYLLTQPPPGQPRLVGSDASHAWVSVPHGTHWIDFDPTNNRCGVGCAGEDYVTLALGRDFGDVSPLRGVIQGGGAHTLAVAVTVAADTESTDCVTPTRRSA